MLGDRAQGQEDLTLEGSLAFIEVSANVLPAGWLVE
jgi:hypothetical protein